MPNPLYTYIYIYIYIYKMGLIYGILKIEVYFMSNPLYVYYLSSSCHVASTDFPDSQSAFVGCLVGCLGFMAY